MDKHQPPHSSFHTLTHKEVRGMELGEEEKIWAEVASSEARLSLMRSMVKEDLAFADLEEFGTEFSNKLKSTKLKNKTLYNKITQPAMKVKLADEQMLWRELVRMKNKMKRDLATKLEGEKTRSYKKTVNYLNKVARKTKNILQEKYKNKIKHLRAKYRQTEEEKVEEIPEDLEEYSNLSVFNKQKYEELKVNKYDVQVIGEVELDDDERAVLSLHNKFSILENLRPGGLDGEQEASIAKLRMEKTKEDKYDGYTKEERQKDEELESEARMIYNPKTRIFDSRKRRVTDLKECTRVTLPKPLSPEDESKIEVRKRTQKEIYEKFRKVNTNERGEQKSNLKKNELKGLKSLQSRIQKDEIIVLKTDKSGRFIVTTPDMYIEMGKEHTTKDREIDWPEMRKMEKIVSSHSVAWASMWNCGEDHNHQDRVLKSKNTRSGNQANLTLLFKDHKQGNKTRPVASGNESYNLGLSNSISELMESVARAKKHPYSVISSEDLLARVTGYNNNNSSGESKKSEEAELENVSKTPTEGGNAIASTVEESKKPEKAELENVSTAPTEGGNAIASTVEDSKKSEKPHSLVGSDVVALFPSIKADNTGKIVRKQIEESEVVFEGFDNKKGRAYIKINEDEINVEDIKHLLPKRKAKTGTTPTMASITSKWNPEDQWIFPEIILNENEEKKIVAAVTNIALKTLFKNFTYKFGGKFFHQTDGGPIGVRATGSASELVMEDWASQYRGILESSGVRVHLLGGYVDDGRQVTDTLDLGMRFAINSKKFEYSEEAYEEDLKKQKSGESRHQRMARICNPAMNSINEDLVFTTETQDDFEKERLPTLDFEMWITEKNQIHHSYFQKPMKTPFVLMERSGTSYQQKFNILTNELTRRLSNIQRETIPQEEIKDKIEEFIGELKNSEYNQKQAKEIVSCGIRGWKSKIRKRKRDNIPFYRLAKDTIDDRMKKELTEKESWYKDKPDQTDQESPAKIRRLAPSKTTCSSFRQGKFKKKNKTTKGEIKSVIFVPHTKESNLARELRDKEMKLQEITGDRIKIVERAGRKLENILTNKDPWKGKDCGRSNCFLCSTKVLTGKDLKKDCTKRNILYEIRCLTCEKDELEKIDEICKDDEDETRKNKLKEQMKIPKYIGESSRSAYERGFEHLDKLASLSSNSHMLKHMLDKHEESDFSQVQWGMFILEFKRTAFERQIEEAVKIQQEASDSILNSRSEWNQSSLPRLTTRIGDLEQEVKEYEKELRIEKEKEEKIEEKIRQLRKTKNKARLNNDRTNPVRKRQKLDEEKYISIRTTWGHPITTAPQEKRSERDSCLEKPSKKIKTGEKLTNIIRIENKVIEGETLLEDEFEIEVIDWDKFLIEHKERLENETLKRESQIERAKEKEKTWELYRECKNYLEENEKNWIVRKRERELENKRLERLDICRQKREELKEKVRERNLENEVSTKLEQLPRSERKKIEIEEEKRRRLDLIQTKKTLWKLRSKMKKPHVTSEKVKRLENIEKLEDKLQMIEKILEETKEETKKREEENRLRKVKLDKEWREKVAQKMKKENERLEQIEKKKLLEQKWEMMKWVTNFINTHQDQWEKEKIEHERKVYKELEDWNKMKRLEKIEILKKKWKKEKDKEPMITTDKEIEKVEKWEVWRPKKIRIEMVNNKPNSDTLSQQEPTENISEIITVPPPLKKSKLEVETPILTKKSSTVPVEGLPSIITPLDSSTVPVEELLPPLPSTMLDSQEVSKTEKINSTVPIEELPPALPSLDGREASIVERNSSTAPIEELPPLEELPTLLPSRKLGSQEISRVKKINSTVPVEELPTVLPSLDGREACIVERNSSTMPGEELPSSLLPSMLEITTPAPILEGQEGSVTITSITTPPPTEEEITPPSQPIITTTTDDQKENNQDDKTKSTKQR